MSHDSIDDRELCDDVPISICACAISLHYVTVGFEIFHAINSTFFSRGSFHQLKVIITSVMFLGEDNVLL